MSEAPAGWYPEPDNPQQMRYWDGSRWTEHTAVAQPPPPPPSGYAPGPLPQPEGYAEALSPMPVTDRHLSINAYDEAVDLSQALTPAQRAQFAHHSLTRFPTWLVVVLHYLTLGIFTFIYQGLKFSKLPQVRDTDFRAGKGIGFMFIPFFNFYWVFRFWLGLADRINFQLRLRGLPPMVSRGLTLAKCIVGLIPYAGLLSVLLLTPIVAGQLQAATNRLADGEGPTPLPPKSGAM